MNFNSNELMIGAVAHDIHNRRLCVAEILHDQGTGWKWLAPDLPEDTPMSIRPINLTYEVLKACDLIEGKGKIFGHHRLSVTLVPRNGMYLVKMRRDGPAITSVKLLHELQMLFFIVAGCMLEIDLDKLENACYGPIKTEA